MSASARKICKAMGIRLKPLQDRIGPMETHSGRTIANLIDAHGEGNMVLTLRILTESNPGNRSHLKANVITAVNDICRISRFVDLGLALVEAFDTIDLGALDQEARNEPLSNLKGYGARVVLTCKIICALDSILGDAAKPVKPATIVPWVIVADRLALGAELIKLKTTTGKAFKRAAYDRFKVDAHGAVAGRSMAVAALYGSRPEITSRLTWDALVALSRPSFPGAVLLGLEARIIAGEKFTADDIRAAAGKQTRGERVKLATVA